MSYFGKFGSRFNGASTACIAALPSEMPFWYILWLSATIGCIPFQVICLAHPALHQKSGQYADPSVNEDYLASFEGFFETRETYFCS